MRKNKQFLALSLSFLAISSLLACSPKKEQPKASSSEEEKPLEIGDTVKEWRGLGDECIPLGTEKGKGTCSVAEYQGNGDDYSLEFRLSSNGYIGSNLVEDPYFLEDDAKNGDIISLYYYLPVGHNIKTLKLEAIDSNNASISGEEVLIDGTNEERWIRLVVSFDTLYTLGSIRLNYTLVDPSNEGTLYIDDINITLGEETVKTGYESNDESLYKTYEDYFKVGSCISGEQIKNTELRKIVKDNFNSITAENEGKPERILDQAACQAALSDDPASVCITTAPFEKIYDWAEANHIGVRHHTFVWYSQTPGWFFTTDYTNNGPKADRQLMLRRMENFIQVTLETINDRWPGLVYAIDVSNEAIDNGHIRNTNNNWYSTVGDDFVYYSFLYAYNHKEEEQELYYNDFSYDYQTSNCAFALNTLLKDVIDEGLIDGVGIQGHLDSGANMDNIIEDARMIKEKGLKCQLTELDITINGNNESNLEAQKKAYKNLTKKILESNAREETEVNAFIVWGITDNSSWKSGQYPLLFTQNYEKKPCYYGVLEALEEAEI